MYNEHNWPCNELGLSAHCLSTASPAPSGSRRPVSRMGSPYRRFPFQETGGQRGADDLIPHGMDIVERFHKTVLDEFYLPRVPQKNLRLDRRAAERSR